MPKNFLMIVDITSTAALSCARYVILRCSYYLRLHLVSRASKKTNAEYLGIIFLMRFLKNSDFYWSMQMKNLTVNLKFK